MMLLMGMWMSLTKKPMKPMRANPIAVATAIFWNSFLKCFSADYCSGVSDVCAPVWLGAPLDQPDRVLAELLQRLQGGHNLVHPELVGMSETGNNEVGLHTEEAESVTDMLGCTTTLLRHSRSLLQLSALCTVTGREPELGNLFQISVC